jgi:hypothetical protein
MVRLISNALLSLRRRKKQQPFLKLEVSSIRDLSLRATRKYLFPSPLKLETILCLLSSNRNSTVTGNKRGHTAANCCIKSATGLLQNLSLCELNEVHSTIASFNKRKNSFHAEVQSETADSLVESEYPKEANIALTVHEYTGLENLATNFGDDWVVNSGAGSHYTHSVGSFLTYLPQSRISNITTAGGNQLPVVGKGSIPICSTNEL